MQCNFLFHFFALSIFYSRILHSNYGVKIIKFIFFVRNVQVSVIGSCTHTTTKLWNTFCEMKWNGFKIILMNKQTSMWESEGEKRMISVCMFWRRILIFSAHAVPFQWIVTEKANKLTHVHTPISSQKKQKKN